MGKRKSTDLADHSKNKKEKGSTPHQPGALPKEPEVNKPSRPNIRGRQNAAKKKNNSGEAVPPRPLLRDHEVKQEPPDEEVPDVGSDVPKKKRGRPPKRAAPPQPEPAPPKKPRGRPPKNAVIREVKEELDNEDADDEVDVPLEPPPKKIGRGRKHKKAVDVIDIKQEDDEDEVVPPKKQNKPKRKGAAEPVEAALKAIKAKQAQQRAGMRKKAPPPKKSATTRSTASKKKPQKEKKVPVEITIKKRRGRPRKNPLPDAPKPARKSLKKTKKAAKGVQTDFSNSTTTEAQTEIRFVERRDVDVQTEKPIENVEEPMEIDDSGHGDGAPDVRQGEKRPIEDSGNEERFKENEEDRNKEDSGDNERVADGSSESGENASKRTFPDFDERNWGEILYWDKETLSAMASGEPYVGGGRTEKESESGSKGEVKSRWDPAFLTARVHLRMSRYGESYEEAKRNVEKELEYEESEGTPLQKKILEWVRAVDKEEKNLTVNTSKKDGEEEPTKGPEKAAEKIQIFHNPVLVNMFKSADAEEEEDSPSDDVSSKPGENISADSCGNENDVMIRKNVLNVFSEQLASDDPPSESESLPIRRVMPADSLESVREARLKREEADRRLKEQQEKCHANTRARRLAYRQRILEEEKEWDLKWQQAGERDQPEEAEAQKAQEESLAAEIRNQEADDHRHEWRDIRRKSWNERRSSSTSVAPSSQSRRQWDNSRYNAYDSYDQGRRLGERSPQPTRARSQYSRVSDEGRHHRSDNSSLSTYNDGHRHGNRSLVPQPRSSSTYTLTVTQQRNQMSYSCHPSDDGHGNWSNLQSYEYNNSYDDGRRHDERTPIQKSRSSSSHYNRSFEENRSRRSGNRWSYNEGHRDDGRSFITQQRSSSVHYSRHSEESRGRWSDNRWSYNEGHRDRGRHRDEGSYGNQLSSSSDYSRLYEESRSHRSDNHWSYNEGHRDDVTSQMRSSSSHYDERHHSQWNDNRYDRSKSYDGGRRRGDGSGEQASSHKKKKRGLSERRSHGSNNSRSGGGRHRREPEPEPDPETVIWNDLMKRNPLLPSSRLVPHEMCRCSICYYTENAIIEMNRLLGKETGCRFVKPRIQTND